MMMESVSSLQRTEEISLNEKLEKEIDDDVELQVQSYKQKLLGSECQDDEIRNFGSWISSRFGVIEAAIENLTQESDDAYYRESGRGFQKKVVDGDDLEGRVSVGIRSGSISSSSSFEFSNPMNCSSSYNEKLAENIDGEVSQLGFSKDEVGDVSQKSKMIFHLSDIEQLRMRLQILEEDYQLMKKEFVMGVEERCELLTEISSQFHIIQQHLRSRVTGERPLEGSSVISSNKDGSIGIGLSQVLHPASSSSLVTRVLKANNFNFQDCTGETQVQLRASLLPVAKVKTF